MKSTKIHDAYAELISLTQLYLLREHSLKETKIVDPTVVDFFNARTNRSSAPAASKKIQNPPTPSTSFVREKSAAPHMIAQQTQQPQDLRRPSPIPPSPPVIHSNEPSTSSPPILPEATTPPQTPPPQIQAQAAVLPSPVQAAPNQNKEGKGKTFSLEPLVVNPPQDYREWWEISRSLFPGWPLHASIPSDAIAKKNKNAWLKAQEITPVVILSFQDNEQQLAFLKNIAQAISLRLAPAQVISATRIEKENGWESILNSPGLSLVIAGDYGLYLHPKLRQFHREVPQEAKHFLKQTPLLLLSDLNLYLKDPQLKPLLWRAICNEFATSQSHRSIESCLT